MGDIYDMARQLNFATGVAKMQDDEVETDDD
jgi:hypothetical protein